MNHKISLLLIFSLCLSLSTFAQGGRGSGNNNQHNDRNQRQTDQQLKVDIKEFRSVCRDIAANIPNLNDPKLVISASDKSRLTRFKNLVNRGTRLPGMSTRQALNKAIDDLNKTIPPKKRTSTYRSKANDGPSTPRVDCDAQRKKCEEECKKKEQDPLNPFDCSSSCGISDLSCRFGSGGSKALLEAFNAFIRDNSTKPTPPTKG